MAGRSVLCFFPLITPWSRPERPLPSKRNHTLHNMHRVARRKHRALRDSSRQPRQPGSAAFDTPIVGEREESLAVQIVQPCPSAPDATFLFADTASPAPSPLSRGGALLQRMLVSARVSGPCAVSICLPRSLRPPSFIFLFPSSRLSLTTSSQAIWAQLEPVLPHTISFAFLQVSPKQWLVRSV